MIHVDDLIISKVEMFHLDDLKEHFYIHLGSKISVDPP